MLKKLWLTCVLICAGNVVSAKTLQFQHWTTSQGTTVYYVNAPEVPILDVHIGFFAGSARDGELPGLANLTADSLGQGTQGANADQIAEAFENVGANFSNGVDRDHATVSLRSLDDPRYSTPAIEMLTRVLSKPTFNSPDFERQRQAQLAAIQQQQQSPAVIANQIFYKTLYPNNPYGNPILGDEASVKKITPDDARRFHQRYYVARNALISIVGSLDETRAKAIAEQLSKALPVGEKAPAIPEGTPKEISRRVAIQYPSSQTMIRIGQLSIPRLSPDYFPLMVGNYSLGGGALTSRLAFDVRETRGLAYDVSSDFHPMMNKGPFVIALGTRTNESQQAISIVNATVDKYIQEGPTAAELIAAKGYLAGGFPLRLDSNSKIANILLAIGMYGLPLDYLDTYVSNINKVTQEQVKAAFKKHIQPSQMTTVLVGQQNTSPAS